jgi:hypothetical protein
MRFFLPCLFADATPQSSLSNDAHRNDQPNQNHTATQ